MSNKNNEIFWINDPMILIYNYLKFVPIPSMTKIEQLNAITLFCIYAIILMLLLKKETNYFYIPVVGIIFMIILYYIDENNLKTSKIETDIKGKEILYDDRGNKIDIQAGYYDSDGKIVIGGSPPKDREKKKDCRMPTENNPFMNPLVSDYGNDNDPVPCNSDDVNVKKDINISFNKDLYRDVEDLFDVKNSQRQFYTIPAPTNPPDFVNFANWAYKPAQICKVDQDKCLRDEDIRYKYVRR
jgi:hypothetical protein